MKIFPLRVREKGEKNFPKLLLQKGDIVNNNS